MKITIRNITKDSGVDFDNDYNIELPKPKEDLNKFLGKDEWIIIDSPVDTDDIIQLNDMLNKIDEKTLIILSKTFYLSEIAEKYENAIILDYDREISKWQSSESISSSDWWNGYLLHYLGYVKFPFEYTSDMEDYVNFEKLWIEANINGWREVAYNYNNYLVYMGI